MDCCGYVGCVCPKYMAAVGACKHLLKLVADKAVVIAVRFLKCYHVMFLSTPSAEVM